MDQLPNLKDTTAWRWMSSGAATIGPYARRCLNATRAALEPSEESRRHDQPVYFRTPSLTRSHLLPPGTGDPQAKRSSFSQFVVSVEAYIIALQVEMTMNENCIVHFYCNLCIFAVDSFVGPTIPLGHRVGRFQLLLLVSVALPVDKIS